MVGFGKLAMSSMIKGDGQGEQRNARKELIKHGVIEAKLKSIPRKWWYKVDLDKLVELILEEEAE